MVAFRREQAHNPKVVGSNPTPATNKIKGVGRNSDPFFYYSGTDGIGLPCPGRAKAENILFGTDYRGRAHPCPFGSGGIHPGTVAGQTR